MADRRPSFLKPDTGGRRINFAELGVRGSFRMLQTVAAVSPRAFKLLRQWRKPAPADVRELFEALGATYIKFGQFIASSPSIFPQEYVEEFQKCLDQTPAIPYSKVRRIIEEDLGKPLHYVYEYIEEEALASASIAQVHAAKLVTGEDVVVKVQKPGVQAVLTTDMNAAYLMVRLMELMMPNVDKDAVAGIVEEMYQAMLDECDFNKEADNLIAFNRFLSSTGNQMVIAPQPYLHATNTKVLTMERFYGVAMTDPEQLDAMPHDASAALFAALNTWFASLTQCDFFHADLHSGNLLLLEDGRVGFIDFGMVGRIEPGVWEAMFKLFHALGEEDYAGIAEAMLKVGMTRNHIDPVALAQDIEAVFSAMYALDPAEVLSAEGGAGVDGVMNGLGGIARQYGIRFPRAFTMLLKQFLYFDRYMQMLAPGADMFRDERVVMMADDLAELSMFD